MTYMKATTDLYVQIQGCNGIDHYDDVSNYKVVDRHAYLWDTKDRR